MDYTIESESKPKPHQDTERKIPPDRPDQGKAASLATLWRS